MPPVPLPNKVNTLLIGSGGREHALALRLSQSTRMGDFYASGTQNPGIASLCKPIDVPVDIREIYRLKQFIDKRDIRLVVIGPEEPLSEGYTDKLADDHTLIFGPTRQGAQLEADKAWAKHMMKAASVPTPDSRVFTDPALAIDYIRTRQQPPVVKAAGLAKGKGVIVPSSINEAVDAVERMMIKKEFGKAGDKIIIEDRLTGPEVSVLALVDGSNILMLPPCQDHKRLKDNDVGPNTGGMGAFCPATTLTDETMSIIERHVMVPIVDALKRDNIDFRGVLYAGIMLTHGGPKVLEFNTRFGDPECQPLMARLKSDLLELCLATCTGTLDKVEVEWDPRPACCVVLAAENYPQKPKTGAVIHGIDEASKLADTYVFHAATKRNTDGSITTDGGRVLSVTSLGETMEAARATAYRAVDLVSFQGRQFRSDIAAESK